jgi:hypothetical protein
VTPEDFKRAEELLRDPDAEDCERFSSWYGRELLNIARAPTLESAMQALYDREINCGLESFWDGGWTAWVGDCMNGHKSEKGFSREDLSAVGTWLLAEAERLYPADGSEPVEPPPGFENWGRT